MAENKEVHTSTLTRNCEECGEDDTDDTVEFKYCYVVVCNTADNANPAQNSHKLTQPAKKKAATRFGKKTFLHGCNEYRRSKQVTSVSSARGR